MAFTTFFFFILMVLWILYYTHIDVITAPEPAPTDKQTKKKTPAECALLNMLLTLLVVWCSLCNYIYLAHFNNYILFWGNLNLCDNTTAYFVLILTVLFLVLVFSLFLFRNDIVFTAEYLIFIFLIGLFSYLLMASTNLFLTFFLLEIISLLVFAKFSATRVTIPENPVNSRNSADTHKPQISYGLFNALFFQFWTTFLSSALLFYSLINIHYTLGISTFFLLNFYFSAVSLNWYTPKSFNTFILTSMTAGLLIKLGIAPYQFFKIEVYRGVPLFMLIIYTILYLIIYIYFFMFLFLVQIPLLRDFTGVYILGATVFAVFYLFSLLFDTANFKAFLSYSTLINVINIFVIIIIV